MSFRLRRVRDLSPGRPRRLTFFETLVLATVLGSLTLGATASWTQSNALRDTGMAGRANLRSPRVVVVKSSRKLHLFDGDRLVRTYSITLGPEPIGQKSRAGDGRTPEGTFRICSKNATSANHRFLGLSYPDAAAAERGERLGLISPGEARAIVDAQNQRRCPVWTTALGGGIGLHGAAGSIDRTAGCIALLDEHIEELFEVLRIGDHVEILP